MAKLTDIFEVENVRQDTSEWNKVHVFKQGDFYRAYNWSAWMVSVFSYTDEVRMQTSDRRPLKVLHKQLKSGDSYLYVGFPAKSINKYIPERTDCTTSENNHLVFTIPLPESATDSKTYEQMQQAYEAWKAAQPIDEKPDSIDEDGNPRKKTKHTPQAKPDMDTPFSQQPAAPAGQPRQGIIGQLMAYQLQNHTDIELRQFVANLQQQVAQMLW